MTANTKLSREQKNDRIEWLTALEYSDGEVATSGRFTVAKMADFPNSRMAHFSVSYCARDEKKIRRKVGEYYALKKLMDFAGDWITLPANISADDLVNTLDELNDYSFE